MSLEISDREPDFNKWKVADLRKELKSRGLSIEGKKNELLERLQLAVGDSALLEDTNDQDEILDEDVLTDDEPFEESELSKPDTPEKEFEKEKSNSELKRKSSEVSAGMTKQPKKIILNRTASVMDKTIPEIEGKENKEKKNSEAADTKSNVVKVGGLSPQERLERRAAKFGMAMSSEAKKEARAARFGLPTSTSKVSGGLNTNIDVLKKRAERFGTTLPGSILEIAEIEEKRKKREERFGKVEKISATTFIRGKYLQPSSMEEKKRLRAQRFKTNFSWPQNIDLKIVTARDGLHKSAGQRSTATEKFREQRVTRSNQTK